MASPSASLDSLAADKRAAVELVLRRGLSYGELASVLNVPEDTIRERVRAGLEALAPDLPPPARSGEIADWLLGQQAPPHASRTRTLVMADAATRHWAETVAAPLRELSGDVPDLAADLPEPRAGASRPRPLRDETAKPAPRAASAEAPPAPPASPPAATAAPSPGRSSRLGGAVLLGAAVVLVGAVIAFVLTRGHDDGDTSSPPVAAATATATATATAIPDILLRGPAGSKAVGAMRLIRASDNTVRFVLAATGLEPNKSGQHYSLWLASSDGKAQWLGDAKNPVSAKKTLTAAGPSNANVDQFPSWFETYDTIVVSLDPRGAKKPGRVMLSGDLHPSAAQG